MMRSARGLLLQFNLDVCWTRGRFMSAQNMTLSHAYVCVHRVTIKPISYICISWPCVVLGLKGANVT